MHLLKSAIFIAAAVASAFSYSATNIVISEGSDYASDILGDAWDMSNKEDVFPLLWTHNLASASVDSGIMTGVARDSDPHFWLHFPQIPSSILPINSQQKTIDADKYNRLSFFMWLPESTSPGANTGRLVWHKGGDTVPSFDAAYSESALFNVYPGWHHYSFDLSKTKNLKGSPWGGVIQGLRIDPCLACAITFKIDWARLWSGQDSLAKYPALPAGKTRLLVDTDNTIDNGAIGVFPSDTNGSVSLAGLPPGRYYTAALSDGDYALAERGDPWDMNSSSDLLWASTSGFSYPAVTNQAFQGATNGPDPFILLDVPSDHPIDASKYRYLSIDMTLSNIPAQESGLLIWWGTAPATVKDHTDFIPVQSGRNTYKIDLGANASWAGIIKALRIDPLNGPNAGSGVGVKINSVRLTNSKDFIETVSFASEPLLINGKPKATLISPSFETGEDYAESELEKPWNMLPGDIKQPQFGNLSGWEYTKTIPDLGISGNFFHATSVPAAKSATEGDPQAFLIYQQNSNPIVADTYRLLGFSLYVGFNAADQNELTRGAMARVAWKDSDTDAGLTSDDIVLLPGLNTYWLDMKKIRYEPASARTWTGLVKYLRIDPLELPDTRNFYLGKVRLTALPTAKRYVPIILDLQDPDNDQVSIEVWSGTSRLASTSSAQGGVINILADISSLPTGENALFLLLNDGINRVQKNVPIPIVKIAASTLPTTYETKSADRIFSWVESAAPHLAPKGPKSTTIHNCAIPNAYARYYSSTNTCLMVIDGAGFFTTGNNTVVFAGMLKELVGVVANAGF